MNDVINQVYSYNSIHELIQGVAKSESKWKENKGDENLLPYIEWQCHITNK